MVRRIYVEKKPALRQEAKSLLNELRTLLGISSLTGVRLINRYDVEGLEADVFQRAVQTVFSEPQVDDATAALPAGVTTPPSPWSICPASSTSGQTPPGPASS